MSQPRLSRILIANRGEIALRVLRACHDTGRQGIAVYADADAGADWLRLADAAFALPGATPAETYLNIPALIEIARRAGAEGVHPGYGFLSENPDFARAVTKAGLVWIGPDADTIAALGDKLAARRIAAEVGAPLLPGTEAALPDPQALHEFASRHGMPVIIKAAAGGGGRGMRVVREMAELAPALAAASREAQAAFGNPACFVERFLDRPRHIEAQVLADHHGRVAVLGLRDCSLQRRHQKLVEEAPAPFLPEDLAQRIAGAARDICRHAGYRGAGTVEFLLGEDGVLSFLEVNTRLQVEHPVTEEVIGIDIVAAQFLIAEGRSLDIPDMPAPRGHAIEFRINAEDPGRGFLPTPGRVTRFDPPAGPGVRVDSAIRAGETVPAAFDSLIAKMIVTGPTRAEALSRARRALDEFRIEGVATTLPFARAVLDAPAFNGQETFAVHTGWIEQEFADGLAAALRVPQAEDMLLRLPVEIDGQRREIGLSAAALTRLAQHLGATPAPTLPQAPPDTTPDRGRLQAPVAGVLARWLVGDGQRVTSGQQVAVIEAMKMEMPQTAPHAGVLHHELPKGAEVSADEVFGRVSEA